MLDMGAHGLAYRPWIGTMPICGDRLWCMANHSDCLLEKSLSCLHISFLTQHGIHQIAIVVDSSIEITPLPVHFEIGFIDIPGFSCLAAALCPQLVRDQGSKTLFPVSNRLMREDKSPF